jgi:hypothetical protein
VLRMARVSRVSYLCSSCVARLFMGHVSLFAALRVVVLCVAGVCVAVVRVVGVLDA